MKSRRLALELSLGFAAGLALWLVIDPAWQRMLTGPIELLARVTESPAVTRLDKVPEGIMVERSDFSPRSPRPIIQARDLTFNVILLVALFSIGKRFSDRNIGRFLIAMGLLFVIHVLFVFVRIKAIYALQLGAWSVANYGIWSRNLWGFLDHFYRIVGIYAAPFLLWWTLGRRER